ncbi:unnamed protein product [Rhizoctonia solani]|uniref:Uncharacterized protein n=1 Tax=Rhizoctonia solani TaxID=456999 RepID=A0A8H2XJW9_9AGAM|nr:unnamed protein product [Rhizoctonia solani]
MDSKGTLEGSAPITPAVSLHYDPRHESVEMTVINRPHAEVVRVESLECPAEATHADDVAAHRREMIAMAAVCWTQFMAGWNDGTLGPLIPTIQEHFHASIIGFMIVSMLFVAACCGYVLGAVAVIYFTDRYGFGRHTTIPCHVCGINDKRDWDELPERSNELSSHLIKEKSWNQDGNDACGLWYVVPGITQRLLLFSHLFTQTPRWSFYFLVSLGLAVSNTISQSLVFGFRTLPELLTSFGIPEVLHTADSTKTSKYKQILNIKVVYVLAFFSLLYVGTEVTIGGWIVTFLIENRGGGVSSGYVSSGFFAGLMLGRLVLLWVNQKLGERRAVYLYSCLIIGLEFVVWFTPSLVLNAVAISIVGLLLGYVITLVQPHPVCLMRF